MKLPKKRVNKRRTKKFLPILFIIFISILTGVSFFLINTKGSRYISPIPKNHIVLSKTFINKDRKQELASLLRSENIDFVTIEASGSAYDISLTNGSHAILATDKDFAGQVSSLQAILLRLTMEGKTFALLDLRFSKPVIRFQ